MATAMAELAAEWETTTVEFKREVTLGSPRQKGEFVKDVLGLVTTKASGRDRYLIIGYDDESHAFAQAVDSRIDQDRLEQILSQYAEPMPEVRYFTVPMPGGAEAGVIEVRRDPARVPYKVRRDIGRAGAGSVFVRQIRSPRENGEDLWWHDRSGNGGARGYVIPDYLVYNRGDHVVVICPNCHRKVHFASAGSRKAELVSTPGPWEPHDGE